MCLRDGGDPDQNVPLFLISCCRLPAPPRQTRHIFRSLQQQSLVRSCLGNLVIYRSIARRSAVGYLLLGWVGTRPSGQYYLRWQSEVWPGYLQGQLYQKLCLHTTHVMCMQPELLWMGTPQLGQSLECLEIHLSEVGSRSPATRCATSICDWSTSARKSANDGTGEDRRGRLNSSAPKTNERKKTTEF